MHVQGREKEGLALNPDMMERREVIRELCEKLDSDDRNIEFANKEVNQAQIQKALVILAVLVILYVGYPHVQRQWRQWQQWRQRGVTLGRERATVRDKSPGSQEMASHLSSHWASISQEDQDIRQARLRKFSAN